MNPESKAPSPEMTKVTITMPVSMHERLQLRARLSGAGSVTEYLRRSEAVYSMLVEIALENGVLASDTIAETILIATEEHVALPPIRPFAGS